MTASRYEFKTIRRVEFSETDMEGIMHYSNFFRFMETVEHGFFRSLGLSIVATRSGHQVCFPRARAECDYLAPLRFEDEVRIHLLVERKGSRSLTYQIRFTRVSGPEEVEVARGRLVVVCASRGADGELKSVTLPPAIAEKIVEAPSHLLLQPHHRERRERAKGGSQETPDAVLVSSEPINP